MRGLDSWITAEHPPGSNPDANVVDDACPECGHHGCQGECQGPPAEPLIVARSNREDVRNPVLALPAAERLMALSPEARKALALALHDIMVEARIRAQRSWKQNKGPMAVYWKAVGAYACHLYRVVRP